MRDAFEYDVSQRAAHAAHARLAGALLYAQDEHDAARDAWHAARGERESRRDAGTHRHRQLREGVKQGTSRRSSEAWQAIDGAAKPNADFFQRQAKSKITAEIKEQKEIELKPIPRPKITVYPAELKGTPDVGEHSIDIRSEPFATYDYEPGSIEYNMKVEGSIHMWTSIGRYDTYA